MTKLVKDKCSFCAHDGADPPENKDNIVAADVTRRSDLARFYWGWKSDWAKRKDPAFWTLGEEISRRRRCIMPLARPGMTPPLARM